LTALVGLAAGQESHSHVPIRVDEGLDWDALIAATLAAHPSGQALAARAAEAAAWTARGHGWLAAAPSLYFSYLSDSPLDDFGQLEYEGGVELPLWHAGQSARNDGRPMLTRDSPDPPRFICHPRPTVLA
jgi:hypothetical protein